MIRISKKVEYALLACRYLAVKGDELAAVKEMSDNLKVSYEFLAKTLQKLSKSGIAKSYQGVTGGYKLIKAPASISIFEIIMAIEGKKRYCTLHFQKWNDMQRSGRMRVAIANGNIAKQI